MNRCKKCDVLIDSPGNNCPLCYSRLQGKTSSAYPTINPKIKSNIVKRIILLIVIVSSALVLFLNRLIVPSFNWSSFVIGALITTYIVLRSIMLTKSKIISKMFMLNFLAIALAIIWDYYTGFHGWSLNFVLPSLCIFYGLFLILLRIISHYVYNEYSTFIYLNILLEFLPILLFYFDIITFEPLASISCIFGVINIAIIFIFDFKRFKVDLEKKLHI